MTTMTEPFLTEVQAFMEGIINETPNDMRSGPLTIWTTLLSATIGEIARPVIDHEAGILDHDTMVEQVQTMLISLAGGAGMMYGDLNR